ncbi:hypothetical protein A2368_03405 [Candidatus Collierbacteria bacterium RIFOXYB1_FULL_49_13]|uniref:Zinc finger DksA/TraR C4-type domain-containing protein n=1 Tax=Candidatus Collierbacteria bacterium RIFOXYB1_FULL_49_13 TaxID=1817728 RepID=A0A1F5FJ85_9BACT|nr:MAG: hypothetical protein A2368_03405 [Candidatus Collierbacteria bacterium RIFOXYB1_FULL_49_13]
MYEYLVSEKKTLLKKRKDLEREDPFSDPGRTDDNAAVDTEVNEQMGHERVSAIREEVDKMLINVKKAMSRIKLGKYGICLNCGKLIDTDRLAVNPTAEYCMTCEKEIEAKNGEA